MAFEMVVPICFRWIQPGRHELGRLSEVMRITTARSRIDVARLALKQYQHLVAAREEGRRIVVRSADDTAQYGLVITSLENLRPREQDGKPTLIGLNAKDAPLLRALTIATKAQSYEIVIRDAMGLYTHIAEACFMGQAILLGISEVNKTVEKRIPTPGVRLHA